MFKSTFLHLRFPFSWLLLPVYMFAFANIQNISMSNPTFLWVFFILHFLLYPASNAYNSYFDKDEEAIGGLKNPPKVNISLYYTALAFDLLAFILSALYVNMAFAYCTLIYGLVSKAYSHPSIRLKKLPYTSLIITGVFQGLFTYVMCYIGINNLGWNAFTSLHVLYPGLLTSAMLMGSYPLTQIYQHASDGERGDMTMSRKLGIKGTFYFVGIFFGLSTTLFVYYFSTVWPPIIVPYLLAMGPVVLFFCYWFLRVYRSEKYANFSNAMWMNFIAATCLNLFFLYYGLSKNGLV